MVNNMLPQKVLHLTSGQLKSVVWPFHVTSVRTAIKGCTGSLPPDLDRECPPSMFIAKLWLLKHRFQGPAKESDFERVEEDVGDPGRGEFIAEALYWSVDPYMRAYAHNYKINDVMPGCQIARVIASQSNNYKIGTIIRGQFGWTTLSRVHPRKRKVTILPRPSVDCLSPSLYLGSLGLTGNTAFFGLHEIAKPKKRHTVVVSGCGGAVGSHVGQLAKLKGSKVIGICGSNAKCRWCTKELGFDHCINYKEEDIRLKLQEVACNGVDIYWDNVGGCISSQVMNEMNTFGKVIVCGAISTYNYDYNWPPESPTPQGFMYFKQLTLQGFLVNSFIADWDDGVNYNKDLIKCGKLKFKEWITFGFENIPKTFIAMMAGENTGKTLVKNDLTKHECDCFTHNRKLAKAEREGR